MPMTNELYHWEFFKKVKQEKLEPLFPSSTDDDDLFFERAGRRIDSGLSSAKKKIKAVPSVMKKKLDEADDWLRNQRYKYSSRKYYDYLRKQAKMGLNHSSELYHHGIPGMKWGRRRYRNADGSLTSAGITRYGQKYQRLAKRSEKRQNKFTMQGVKADQWLKKANDYEQGTLFHRPNPKKAAKYKRKGLNARWKASKRLAREKKREQRLSKSLNKRFNPADSARIRREYLSDYSYWR